MSPLVSARETAFGEIALRSPYSQGLVDDLKTEIPARHRRWDPDEKVWRVTEPHVTAAVDLLLTYHPGAPVPGVYAQRTAVAPVADDCPPWEEAPWWDASSRPTPTPAPKPAPKVVPIPARPTPPHALEDGAPTVARISCPTCTTRLEQPIRAHVETGARVARSERPPAELVTVCPTCRDLLVLSFAPGVAAVVAV